MARREHNPKLSANLSPITISVLAVGTYFLAQKMGWLKGGASPLPPPPADRPFGADEARALVQSKLGSGMAIINVRAGKAFCRGVTVNGWIVSVMISGGRFVREYIVDAASHNVWTEPECQFNKLL